MLHAWTGLPPSCQAGLAGQEGPPPVAPGRQAGASFWGLISSSPAPFLRLLGGSWSHSCPGTWRAAGDEPLLWPVQGDRPLTLGTEGPLRLGSAEEARPLTQDAFCQGKWQGCLTPQGCTRWPGQLAWGWLPLISLSAQKHRATVLPAQECLEAHLMWEMYLCRLSVPGPRLDCRTLHRWRMVKAGPQV